MVGFFAARVCAPSVPTAPPPSIAMSNSRQHRNHEFTGTARASTYREGYPSGWYRLLDLDELKPGDVRALDCLGKNLVVFRGKESGAYRVLDAHCPHQGASLAGGDVQGDNLACPFHHWCFGGDGRLKEIPNTDKRPRVGVRSYPVREHYGMLWMFHDVSGEALDTPPYEPEPIPELEDGTFRYRGRHTVADVGMHLSEFVENSVDFQHFDVLHGDLTWPWTQIKIPWFGVQHEPGWEVDETDGHKAYFTDFACVKFRGKAYPKSGAHARITLFGPGGTVWFRFSLPELGDIILFQTHLPKEPMRQEIRFRWFADPKVPRLLVWWVIGHWISQWKADVEIWENKVFRERPALIALDGPVHKMRRWYKQFYESSVPAEDADAAPAKGPARRNGLNVLNEPHTPAAAVLSPRED